VSADGSFHSNAPASAWRVTLGFPASKYIFQSPVTVHIFL